MRGHNDDLIITWAMYAHLKNKVYGSRPKKAVGNHKHACRIQGSLHTV